MFFCLYWLFWSERTSKENQSDKVVNQKVIRQLIQTDKNILYICWWLFVTSILSPERHSINENSNKIECQDRNNWLFCGFLYHTSTDIEKLNDFVYGLGRYVINDVFSKSVGCFLAFITPSRRLGYKCSYSPPSFNFQIIQLFKTFSELQRWIHFNRK